ncbi:MAG: family 10 glycosylhydrolase, partial [Dolichospermum sp.]
HNHFRQKLLKPLFRSWLLISLITVFWVNTLTPVNAQIAHQEIRGVWITNNDLNILKDRTKVQEAVTQLRELNFNTVYPVVWNAG